MEIKKIRQNFKEVKANENYYDDGLEGVAGVVSFENQTHPAAEYYEEAKKLLTEEVNAAVEGLCEAGIDDILVVDGHGPGAISYPDLRPPAKLLHGRPFPWKTIVEDIIKRYDATVMIGQHAMAAVKTGALNHTQSSKTIEYYKLNGKYIGEIAQWALCCGAADLPLLFLSGDKAACKEVEELIPDVTTAEVKEGLTRSSAISLAPKDARELIKNKIIDAIRKHNSQPVSPLKWDPPYILEKRFLFTEIADIYDSNPLYERVDAKTVRIHFDNTLDIYFI